MTVLIEFKTDVFRTALSCFFDYRGGIWVGRDSKVLVWFFAFASVCVSPSLGWMASKDRPTLGLCLGECRVSGDWWFFDGGLMVKSWIKLVELIVLPTGLRLGRFDLWVCRGVTMLKGKAIRVEGWVCWFDRLWQTDVLWFTGGTWGWVIFWLSCLFDVRFDWQGIKRSLVEQWSILIGGQGSRFAIVAGLNCVIWLGFTLFVYQEFWSVDGYPSIDWYWWDQWWNQVWPRAEWSRGSWMGIAEIVMTANWNWRCG